MQNAPAPAALKWSTWTLALAGHTRGVAGIAGAGQLAAGQGSRWRLSLGIVPMAANDALATRAWLHSLRGRSGSAVIQLLPKQLTGPVSSSRLIIFTDGTPFSDGTGFETITSYNGGTSGVINSALAAGATSGVFNVNDGAMPVVGDLAYIGSAIAGAGQLVRLTAVSAAGNLVTASFLPALRAAYAAGEVVAAGTVFGRWRLAGEVPAVPLVNGRSLAFNIDLEEAY